jgi:chromosome segregation ATPase
MLPDLKTPLLWVLGLGLVAALATAGIERTRAAEARADLASEKADRAKENTARALAALADLQRIVALMASHAQTQQENVNAFENRLKTLDDRRRTVTAERDRLRKQYDDFAARDRDQATSDPAACQRVADRSAVLAAMAARSRELLEGGRLVVEGRDNEVQLLLDTVSNDRALFAPPALPTASP